MATNEDLTQPISESYFNLSADTAELTFPNKLDNVNSLSEKDLLELIEKIDKQKVRNILENSIRDTSSPKKPERQDPIELTRQLSLSDSFDDIDIFIQSTPKTPKEKPSSKQITLNELAKMLHPVLNEEFNELKNSIKGILADKKQKSNLQSQLNVQSDDDISRLSPPQGSQLDLKLSFESPETTPPTSKEKESRNKSNNDMMNELEKLRLENKMIRMENDNLKTSLKTNQQLEYKFNQSKKYNKELLNELNYMKVNKQQAPEADNAHETPKNDAETPTPSFETTVPINEDTISSSFKNIYNQLNLRDIDKLTPTKSANLVKNILLKLMIDYRDLPHKLDEFINIYKHMTRFINNIHNLVYDEDIVIDINNFEKCLQDMLSVIRDHFESSINT